MLSRRKEMLARIETRNRDIFAASQNGRALEDLAQLHELSPVTVRQIVNREKLKRAISPVAYYRALRQTVAVAQAKGG
jgi:Mor family transcriptional regulator